MKLRDLPVDGQRVNYNGVSQLSRHVAQALDQHQVNYRLRVTQP